MKMQCNSCEVAVANLLCCADEAALCWACDEKVHAANKLASKHQRVLLSNSSSQMPKCDICQETTGYFFCLEDRALLCRKCDVAIHTANSYVSTHQRFLLTGVKVGLESNEPLLPSPKEKFNSMEGIAETPSRTVSKTGTSMSLSGENNKVLSGQGGVGGGLPVAKVSSQGGVGGGLPAGKVSSQGGVGGGLAASKVSFCGGTVPAIIPDWPLEEFLGLTDFNQDYGFMEHGSSKADRTKLGNSEWSPIYRAVADEDLDIDECLGQVGDVQWKVPEIPSPPTASGLYWPRNLQDISRDNSVFVPDVCQSMQYLHGYQLNPPAAKRQRRS
ncbi:light-regulated zinc finger protein 1 isoform X2 [Tasmannia lanceolata]|uniref:light-regulated zinc finger protein 1 isoform X2 n=1 Tax=Tasmannia lanceolata TaxID=3420 RepID=UPI004063F25F